MQQEQAFNIFEDQEDYLEDIKEEFRGAIRRFTLYSKMFSHPKDYKEMKDEIRKFLNFELEQTFHKTVIRETSDGIIRMNFSDE